MPKIPKGSFGRGVSADIGAAQISNVGVGAVEDAMAGFGGEVAKFGFDLQARRTRAEADDHVTQQSFELTRELEGARLKAREDNPDGFGYSEAFEKSGRSIQKKFNAINGPSNLAQQTMKDLTVGFINESIIKVESASRIMKVDTMDARVDIMAKESAEEIRASGNSDTMFVRSGIIQQSLNINALGRSDKERTRVANSANDKMKNAYISGILTRAQPGEVLALESNLNNDVGHKQFFSTKEISSILGQISSLKKRKSSESDKELKVVLNEVNFSMQRGGVGSQSVQELNVAIDNSNMEQFEKVRQKDKLKISSFVSSTINDLQKSTPAEVSATLSGIESNKRGGPLTSFNSIQRAKALDNLKNALVIEREIVKEDPKQKIIETDSNVENLFLQSQERDGSGRRTPEAQAALAQYHVASDGIAEHRGYGKVRATTKLESEQLGNLYNSAIDVNGKVNAILNMHNEYGRRSGKAISEWVQDDAGVDNRLAVTGQMDSKASIKTVVQNVENRVNIEAAFKESAGLLLDAENIAMEEEAVGLLEDFRIANSLRDPTGKGDSLYLSVKSNIILETKRLMDKEGIDDIDDAMLKAKATILDSNFTTIEAGNSKVFVSNRFVKNKVNVKKFMEAHDDDDSYGSMRDPDDFEKTSPVFVPGGQDKDDWYDFLEDSAKWITNEDGSGVVLVYDHPGGGLKKVFNENKKPLEFSFEDLDTNTDERTRGLKNLLFGIF